MTADPDGMQDIVAHVRAHARQRAAVKACAAAIYARISKDTQASIPVQLEACRRYAARLGLPIAAEFTEEKSGLITARPEYQHMLALARSGKVSHLILFKADRFGREDGEYITAFRQLEKLGLEVHGTDIGHVEPSMVGIHAFISNQEVRNISARVLPSQIYRAQHGLAMQRPPFGYCTTRQRGVFEPDDNATIVTELFQRYAGGETVYSLTKWFNACTGMGKRSFGTRRLLENPFYAGVIVFNRERDSKIDGRYAKDRKEWVYATHETPLVDKEVWHAVQARLATNQHIGQERAVGPQYPLTGLIWCAACQKRVHGQPDETGKYPFYHCPYCGKSKSNRKVERSLRRLLETVPIGMDAIAAAHARDIREQAQNTTAPGLEMSHRIEHLQERRKRLTLLYVDEQIQPADYQAAIAETDEELLSLRTEQETMDRQRLSTVKITVTIQWLQTLTSWPDLLDGATIAQRNDIYRQCLTACRIDYHGNCLTVHWEPFMAYLMERDEVTVPL